jgi:putative serine protease PepD
MSDPTTPQDDRRAPQGWPAPGTHGPYGGPMYGYGSPTYGSAPQGGMPPYDPAAEGHPATGPRRRRAGLTALAIAGCLLAGTAGGAIGVGLADDSSAVPTRSGGSATASQTSLVDATVQGAAAEIMPSTVVISVTGMTSGPSGQSRSGGSGSGVVLDTDGHILTNAHVVSAVSNATVEVMLADGRVVAAEIVGVDESSDLAVLKVDGGAELEPAVFADSDALDIGQSVVAVGAPLGLSGTVTEGIVSAVDRPVRTGQSADASTVLDAIQTDAAINPGNSGGPLVNLAGEVIGINSAIATVGASGGQAGNIGVGFAIPSNDATDIAGQLIVDGTAEHASLGISASESETGRGATVQEVEPGSAAADAGLQDGDVIAMVEERVVLDLDSLLAAVRDHAPGDEVTLTVSRDGSEQTVSITLGSRSG